MDSSVFKVRVRGYFMDVVWKWRSEAVLDTLLPRLLRSVCCSDHSERHCWYRAATWCSMERLQWARVPLVVEALGCKSSVQ